MERLGFFLILVASICTTTIASSQSNDISFLHQCANHVGEQCGKQVYNKMFTSSKTEISIDCCYKLFDTGSYCHTKMTLFILETNQKYENEEWIHYLTRADDIFNKCDLATRPDDTKFLSACVEKIGSRCGEEVLNSIVNNTSTSKKCCDKLVNMGERCHTNMAKILIRTPEMKNMDPIEFMERSKNVYDECSIE